MSKRRGNVVRGQFGKRQSSGADSSDWVSDAEFARMSPMQKREMFARRRAAKFTRRSEAKAEGILSQIKLTIFFVIAMVAVVAWQLWGPARILPPQEPDIRTAAGTPYHYCHVGGGTNCVVDGDTIYMNGVKIRLLDIDTPETHDYFCEDEKTLGDAATRRLHQLVNGGEVTAARGFGERDEDQYGRKLRVVMVDGEPVGDVLVAEGLARWYGGGRRSWC